MRQAHTVASHNFFEMLRSEFLGQDQGSGSGFKLSKMLDPDRIKLSQMLDPDPYNGMNTVGTGSPGCALKVGWRICHL